MSDCLKQLPTTSLCFSSQLAVLFFALAAVSGAQVASATKAQVPAVTEVDRKASIATIKALKAEDVPEVLRRAEAGDATAQSMLGTEAAIWFRKAADQGEAQAEFDLGRMYDSGQGVVLDHAEAARWYTKAAEHELPDAQFNLAIAYHDGEGVPKGMDDAEKWFTNASDAGWAPASFYLGKMYADKRFQASPLTGELALKFLEKSAEQGYPLGAFALADIYSSRFVAYHLWASRDDKKACHWLLVAHELSKQDRWESFQPGDSATVRKELPARVSKMEKNLKGGFVGCEQSAAEWARAHQSSSTR